MVLKLFFIALATANLLVQGQSPSGDDNGFTFNVITLPSHTVNKTETPANIGVALVDINRFYPLDVSGQSNIIYTTTVPNDAFQGNQTLRYKYVKFEPDTQKILDAEPFIRTFSLSSEPSTTTLTTLNEFYGREQPFHETKTFPSIVDNNSFYQGFHRAPNQLHKNNEIITIHLTGEDDAFANIHENYLDDLKINVDMTYISANEVKQFYGCKLSIAGRSSRQLTKLPYNIKLGKGDDLGGYSKLKLRASASDPSYLREKLTTELLYATGRPATMTSFVRVFINDKPVGLFLLAEKYSDDWLGMEYNEGKDSYQNGVLYKPSGSAGKSNCTADLSYFEDNTLYNDIYKVEEPSEVKDVGMQDLINFTKFVDDQIHWQMLGNNSLDTSAALWEKKMNVKGFITNMVLEFLLGSWDSYIQNAQNYYLYKQPNDDQLMDWIAWDFDFTLGNGIVDMNRMVDGNYRSFSGTTIKPLTRAILLVPSYQKEYELQLRTITEKLFNPSVAFPIIDDWKQFIKQDAEWDMNLPRLRTGHSSTKFRDLVFPNRNNTSNADSNTNDDATTTDEDSKKDKKKKKKDAPMSLPTDFNMKAAIAFFFRVNAPINIDRAVDGPLQDPSLLSLKEFIQKKSDNVNNFFK
ncbi:unnamed protein product [Cunninghamella blakesleeana]